MQKNLSFLVLITLVAALAVGLSFAADPQTAKPTSEEAETSGPDVIALEPGSVDDDATPLFCADQGCSCNGAGCRCTTSTGSYCTNAPNGQTCTSGPCGGSGGGDDDVPAQDIFQQLMGHGRFL